MVLEKIKIEKKQKREGEFVPLPPPSTLCTEVSSPSSLNPRDLTVVSGAGAGAGAGGAAFSGEASASLVGSADRGVSRPPSAGAAGVGGGAATVSSVGSAMDGTTELQES